MLPNIEIIKVLSEAYSPCQSFGKCKEAQWLPEEGHIPRGFLGATGSVDEVEAIFVFAEPGHPMMNEHGIYPESLDPEGYMELTTDFAFKCFDKEVAEYAGVASYRNYHEYKKSGDTTLDLLYLPVSEDIINNNRLLKLRGDKIHFLFEET